MDVQGATSGFSINISAPLAANTVARLFHDLSVKRSEFDQIIHGLNEVPPQAQGIIKNALMFIKNDTLVPTKEMLDPLVKMLSEDTYPVLQKLLLDMGYTELAEEIKPRG